MPPASPTLTVPRLRERRPRTLPKAHAYKRPSLLISSTIATSTTAGRNAVLMYHLQTQSAAIDVDTFCVPSMRRAAPAERVPLPLSSHYDRLAPHRRLGGRLTLTFMSTTLAAPLVRTTEIKSVRCRKRHRRRRHTLPKARLLVPSNE